MNNHVALYNQAKNAKNSQELMELCRANGLELSQEEAERAMSALYTHGEIATDELAQCAGGCSDLLYYLSLLP